MKRGIKVRLSGERLRGVELVLEAGSVRAFTGFNATLKSASARAILLALLDLQLVTPLSEELLGDRLEGARGLVAAEVEGVEGGVLGYVVEDYRLVLRAYLQSVKDKLEELRGEVRRLEAPTGRSASEAYRLIKEVEWLLSGSQDVLKLKESVDTKLLSKAERLVEEVLGSVAERAGVRVEDVAPLHLTVTGEGFIVRDERLGSEVQVESVSSAVSSALLWELTKLFFSVPAAARFLVVEEPEEAMSPLQQVAYARALERLAKEMPGDNYAVVTTHSPYVAAALSAAPVYFRWDWDSKMYVAEESTLPPSFTLAELLLLKGGG